MSRTKKLSPKIVAEVVARAGRGVSLPKISAWLLRVHTIEISSRALSTYVRRARHERGKVTRKIVEAALVDTSLKDIAQTDRSLRQMRQLRRIAREQKMPNIEVKATTEIRNLLTLRAKLSGADDRAASDALVEGLFSLTGLALNDEEHLAELLAHDDRDGLAAYAVTNAPDAVGALERVLVGVFDSAPRTTLEAALAVLRPLATLATKGTPDARA